MFTKRLSQARTFLALVVLSVVVHGCSVAVYGGYAASLISNLITRGDPIPSPSAYCPPPLDYKVVNNTKQTIVVDHFYRTKDYEKCPNRGYYKKPQNVSIPPGDTHFRYLVDPYYDLGEIGIAPTTLIAIRLNESTIAYYTGYPQSPSNELSSWITANQSNLPPSFYTPMPTVDTIAYGLFYIVNNIGRARLGLPTINPDRHDIYTSLDSLNRPHGPKDFLITFTVNGPNKSDINISYKGTLR